MSSKRQRSQASLSKGNAGTEYPFISEGNQGVSLRILVRPRASKNSVKGIYGDYLKIDIKAPPVDGAANKELIKFLSKFFKIPKSDIEVKSGKGAKTKLLIFKGITPSKILTALGI